MKYIQKRMLIQNWEIIYYKLSREGNNIIGWGPSPTDRHSREI